MNGSCFYIIIYCIGNWLMDGGYYVFYFFKDGEIILVGFLWYFF